MFENRLCNFHKWSADMVEPDMAHNKLMKIVGGTFEMQVRPRQNLAILLADFSVVGLANDDMQNFSTCSTLSGLSFKKSLMNSPLLALRKQLHASLACDSRAAEDRGFGMSLVCPAWARGLSHLRERTAVDDADVDIDAVVSVFAVVAVVVFHALQKVL